MPFTYTKEEAARFERFGDTANGVPFDWGLASAEGAWFILVPTKGVHSQEDVDKAKRIIKSNRDVVGSIKVCWLEPKTQHEESKL